MQDVESTLYSNYYTTFSYALSIVYNKNADHTHENLSSPIFKLCKCRKTSQPLCHYIIKNVAVKVKMNVEDNLDSDIFYDFWQLSGYAVALCRNLGHNSKIIANHFDEWAADFGEVKTDYDYHL